MFYDILSYNSSFAVGRSYLITSKFSLNQCIDSLAQKCQPGVVVHFEKIGPDPEGLF